MSGQGDLFAAPEVRVQSGPDMARVRARLGKILSEARARAMPWDEGTLKLYRTIVPQMSQWLPADEAAQVKGAFDAEMARMGVR